MDWRQWLAEQAADAGQRPYWESAVIGALLTFGAFGVGWLSGARLGPWVASSFGALMGRDDEMDRSTAARSLSAIITILLLLVALRSAVSGLPGRTIMAVGMALAVGVLAERALRGVRVSSRARTSVAVILGFLAGIAAMGGAAPILTGMDRTGFSVGGTRLTLLSLVNGVIVAAVLFVSVRLAIRVLNHLVSRSDQLDPSQQLLIQKIGGVLLIGGAVLFGIDLIGIDLTALAVFSGALGLAVGFGLQKTFGNLLAGVILLMDRSVKPGDVIVVGDTFGEVNKIGVRAVSVVTRDGKEHLIPNEQLMVEPVENWSYSNRNVRIHIPVGVAYSSDIALAQRLMIQAAVEADRVLKVPKPSVWLTGFGDSSVDHEILIWIGDPEMGVGNLRSIVLNRLWTLFAENNIEIPFPQRDIHIRTGGPASQARGGEPFPSASAED